MTKSRTLLIIILLIGLFAGFVRVYAAQRLDVDYDEPVYLGAAVEYANDIRQGEYNMLAWSENTFEHPALYKILYGVALLTQRPLEKFHISDLPRLAPIRSTEAREWAMSGRYLSAFLAGLAALALAAINPVGGLLLAINSLGVKYTSQVYLEALPLLTSLLSALAYLRWFRLVSRDRDYGFRSLIWLAASAIFLGMTAAGKYVYCVVGFAIVLHTAIAILQKQIPGRLAFHLLGWGVLSILMFFVFDPYLWPHPFSRLMKTLVFHVGFQESNIVKAYHYPWYQPLQWLWAFSALNELRPPTAFLFRIDQVLCILAIIGLPRLFRRNRFFFYWLVIGLLFLLIWTTKWPQYTLIILVPYCVSASDGVYTIVDWTRQYILPRVGHFSTPRKV
jgi:hypothetical protein